MTTISNCTTSDCGTGGATDATNIAWGTGATGTNVTSATDVSNGSNTAGGNTSTILAYTSANGGTAPAASFCSNLNYGGYTDWYLPSINELSLLYTNYAAIGGFQTGAGGIAVYLSSTESSATAFRAVNFHTGGVSNGLKTNAAYFKFRCVRRY